MTVNGRPWARVKTPVVLPENINRLYLEALSDDEFAELLRSNLVPHGQSREDRARWEMLWSELRATDSLAEHSYDVLEEFLDTSEPDLQDESLTPEQKKRVAKFVRLCTDSWTRLDRGRSRNRGPAPLEWAGESAQRHPVQLKHDLARLVGAIARHRGEVLRGGRGPSRADADLWDTLRAIGLDPRDFPAPD